MSQAKLKKYQDEITIKRLYSNAFNKNSDNILIFKLSGGLKNKVYLIEDNMEKYVLKIFSKSDRTMIYVDQETFWWEAYMLKFLESIDYPSPHLLYYDDTLRICDEPYIFMTYINGNNYLECKDKLNKKTISKIEYQIGKLCLKLSEIQSNNYFLPSNPESKFNNNYEFVLFLFEKLLQNAKECYLDLTIEEENEILYLLTINRNALNDNIKICLTHTDIWDGNIMIENGTISGIVDFSDLYFCDELMTFYFHTIDGILSEDFLNGYQKKSITFNESIRIEIYRMYVILKMIVDCKLKEYGRFDWMYENLNKRIAKIKQMGKNML